jgi:hypothetical protein
MAFLGIVLSPNSVASRWVKEELELALNNQIQQAQVSVISILFRECALPGFLKGKEYVDFSAWSRSRKNDHRVDSPGFCDPTSRVINRDLFSDRLKAAFEAYLAELRASPSDSGVWKKARRRIWWLIRMSA